MLPSPPDLTEHSDTEFQISKTFSRTEKVNRHVQEKYIQKDTRYDSMNNNVSGISINLKGQSCNKTQKENLRPLETKSLCMITKKNKSVGNKYSSDSSYNSNIPAPSNTNIYTSNIQQRYSQKDISTDVNMHRYSASCSTNTDKENANVCTCCPIHTNNNEKFRRVFKELFLLREMTKECYEDLKISLKKENADKTDNMEATFLSTFQFPLQHLEELDEVEEYLQISKHFQSAAAELSKMGGTTLYDFVKRCLSVLLSNRFAEQYSWHGAKKSKCLENYFLQMCYKKVLCYVKQRKIGNKLRKLLKLG